MADFSDRLKEVLLATQPQASVASGGNVVVFRCPYCGDSHNSSKSKHFYVSLGYVEPVALGFCHKCQIGLLITNEILASWGIYDVDLGTKINKAKAYAEANSKYNRYTCKDTKIYTLNNTSITPSQLAESKLKYINDRLDIKLTFQDLLDKKIVLNLFDVLRNNNINKLNRNKVECQLLDHYFIGFISQDNSFINCRNLAYKKKELPKGINKRYLNYSVYGKSDNSKRFYLMPTNIDRRSTEKIKVRICEGPFDALSIYYNLTEQAPNEVIIALTGCGYSSVLDIILSELQLFNCEVHFYKDNDVVDTQFFAIGNLLKPYGITSYLHWNEYPQEKDFGVKKKKILERVIKLI